MYLPETIQIVELPIPEKIAATPVKISDKVELFVKNPK
jgi:hypothetical protein